MPADLVAKPNEELEFKQRVWFDDFNATPTSGHIRIRRVSDGKYWEQATTSFITTETWNATTVQGAQKLHEFDWTTPTASGGEGYQITMRINADKISEDVINLTVRPEGSGFNHAGFALNGTV